MTDLKKTMNQKWTEEAREAMPAKIDMLAQTFNELGTRWATVARSLASPGSMTRIEKAALMGLAAMVKDDAWELNQTLTKALREDEVTTTSDPMQRVVARVNSTELDSRT